jgi:hypothetical protein
MGEPKLEVRPKPSEEQAAAASPSPEQDPLSKERRTQFRFFVVPKFQMALIAANLVIVILIMLGAAAAATLAYGELWNIGILSKFPPKHLYFKFLAFQWRKLIFALGITAIVSAALSSFLTLVISHRLAGPLVRLRKHFEGMADGSAIDTPLKFRKGDYLSDLAPIINRAVLRLRGRSDHENPPGE